MIKKLSLKDTIRVGFGAALIVSSGCTDHGSIRKSDISETTLPRTTPAVERFAFEGAKFVAGKGVTVSEGQPVREVIEALKKTPNYITAMVNRGVPGAASGSNVILKPMNEADGYSFVEDNSDVILGDVKKTDSEITFDSANFTGANMNVILERNGSDPQAFINTDKENAVFVIRDGVLVPENEEFETVPSHDVEQEMQHGEFDPKIRDFEGVATVTPNGNVAVVMFEPIGLVS